MAEESGSELAARILARYRPGRHLLRAQEAFLLALILAAAGLLRFYGLNWDGGHWLHPDERQIYFVTAQVGWPDSLAQALSPDSPLNPGFFAYGSLPFYLLRVLAALFSPLWPALRDPDNLHRLGRPLAALVGLGTVYLTYRLGCALPLADPRRGGSRAVPLLGAALMSVAVLPIQLAHAYTADGLLAFFVVLALCQAARLARGGHRRGTALGLAVGLALATKLSAAPLLLVVPIAYTLRSSTAEANGTRPHPPPAEDPASRGQTIRGALFALGVSTAVFVAVQPYALVDWRTFLSDTVRESQIAWGTLDVPYTRQYAGTWPYLYSIWQTALWGLGLPLGLVAWAGLGAAVVRWLRRGPWSDWLLLAWAGPYLGIVGLSEARHLRYMLPLVPVLCLLAAGLMAGAKARWLRVGGAWLLGVVTAAYAVLFVSLYASPHPWIEASEWIYATVPAGSTLAVEEWDTPLPLPLDAGGQPRRIEQYEIRTLGLYQEPDGGAKWAELAAELAQSDYVILASRRLYGSIPRLAERYPIASRYYALLLSGELGFVRVAEFTREPAWLNPPIPPLPDAAPRLFRPDESFVVYDHPRALLFQNQGRLSSEELLQHLPVQ